MTLLRAVRDVRALWRAWLPLLLLTLLTPPTVLAMPLLEKYLIDSVMLAQRLDRLAGAVALYAGLWLLATGMQVAGGTLRTFLGERITMHVRQRLFDQSAALSLAFAHREQSGRTLSLFLNDAPIVSQVFSATLLGGFGSLVTLAIGAGLMFSLSRPLALAIVVAAPLVAALVAVLTRPVRAASRRVQDMVALLSQRLQEHLSGLREVIAFGQEQAQARRFGATMGELLRLRMRVAWMDTGIQSAQTLFSLTVQLAIFGYGGYLVARGRTSVGTLVAMRGLFAYVFQPASQLFGSAAAVQKSLGAVDRLYGFLDESPRVGERPGARAPRAGGGAVAFEQVDFAYQPGLPILRGGSFVAEPGELVALVGPSGAGKSTLASLLLRFYDPDAGRILLDGSDLRDLTLAGLRAQVGVVFQDTFLFSGSIRENIAFGRAGASEEEVVAAAHAAHAWEFIARLPAGLDSPVGERGVQLSEGQKQRLAIARALLRDPRLLILDEPTSALDARSEHLLQAALETLLRGRTAFVIAHRLATVRRADRILVLDGGRIVEQGRHDELLARPGLYRELYTLQFGALVDGRAGLPAPTPTGAR